MHCDMISAYQAIRKLSQTLVEPLSEADAQLQSMEDASPSKWHLAHTTWFFETLILKSYDLNYEVYHPTYQYLFNSYYNGIGSQYTRSARGQISRPSLSEIMMYREYVDGHMLSLLEKQLKPECLAMITLGLNHEQQHQELLLTDIKHALFLNPLFPSYRKLVPVKNEYKERVWIEMEEGLNEVGYCGEGFAFDNEYPRHKVYLNAFSLSSRLITQGEYLEFIKDGGYQNPMLWLSDGWSHIKKNQLHHPLYWQLNTEGIYENFTLDGIQPILINQPVTHLSYFEADAFARWAGARLPTEFEWEVAASTVLPAEGGFLDLQKLHPGSTRDDGLAQMFGECWQWTSSHYAEYPGYQPFPGLAGEYNGKFMCGQQVLRGGSCATPKATYRHTYRNFFYPHQSWQFTGLRLAK